jgi:uncharacterized membrane protein YkvA (DUF1232 family)
MLASVVERSVCITVVGFYVVPRDFGGVPDVMAALGFWELQVQGFSK